jgi:uncharacterized membrane protein
MFAANPVFRRRSRAGLLCVFAGLLVVLVATGAGRMSSRAQSSPAPSAGTAQQTATAVASTTSVASQPAVASAQAMAKPAQAGPAADAQKQEAAAEAADLLKMATALKTEVDKSTKDTLSVTVVRKAGEIEQLAHKVRMGTGKG